MRRQTALLAILPALLLATGCDIENFGDPTRYQAEFKESHPMEFRGRFYLENFNGSVEISGWDQPTAEITGTKYAASESALDAIKIDVVASGDSLRVRTVRPSGHSGNMGARYTIRVPKQLMILNASTSNGAIRVRDVEAAIRLDTSNGAIELNSAGGSATVRTSNGRIQATGLRGPLDASTSNGSITAVLTDVDPGRTIRLRTSNGSIELSLDRLHEGNEVEAASSNSSITLRLPVDTSARVTARTSNGRITNEFESAFSGRSEKTRLEGTIGNGGPRISLTTSNGSIRLLKR